MKLYVGNLSFNTTQHDLETAFQEFGNVSEVALITDRETGNSRGFAFVTMGSRGEGKAAIEGMQGREVDGRTLSVSEARPREENSGGGRSKSYSRPRRY
ncbi:MAG: RNA-binding protein [Verrucomicrobia bacterium]|nr:RNA-binding protein [Verrucomicrobiota bacterium]